MTQILVIDPQRCVRNSIKGLLEHEGFTVEVAETAESAPLTSRMPQPDLVVCGDLQPSPEIFSGLPWIALAPDQSVERAVQLVRCGASDVVPKPVSINRLLEAIRTTLGDAAETTVRQPSVAKKKSCRAEEIIGHSAQIEHVRRLVAKVAPSGARVLITGANGTGKEVVARQLHFQSDRAEGPFVEVNCAAIPSELIESELFGHEKGAFTSAVKQRKGKFEQAIGGTIFLDEVGDMSLAAQAKVLRALQERKICRVGSDRDIDIDVRVIAATNKNLREEISKGNFREDLYHRLGVIVIHLPSVVERSSDIPEIIGYFLTQICAEYGIAVKPIEPDAVEELAKRSWTGNIREIRNVVERLVILSGTTITCDDVNTYTLGVY